MSSSEVSGHLGQPIVSSTVSGNGLKYVEGPAEINPQGHSATLPTPTLPAAPANLGQANLQHGLGHAAVLAHGLVPRSTVVICASFITAAWGANEGALPVNLIPSPADDAYLNFFAVPAAASGETVLALRLQPGMLDYYRRVGILDDSVRVIEVDPKLTPGGRVIGYPATDPLALYADQGGRFDQGEHFVAVFPGQQGALIAQSIGLEPIQQYCPDAANSKAKLHQCAQQYGYDVLPGVRLHSAQQIVEQSFQEMFAAGPVWLKLAHGSGGDLVVRLPDARICTLRKGIDKLRASAQAAFDSAVYGIEFEDFWPQQQFAPMASALVLERDASMLGSVLVNGSCNFTQRSDGTFEVLGFFRQRVDGDGNYCGSECFNPSNDQSARILEQVRAISRYLADHNYAGLAGIDFMEIEGSNGPEVRVIELNARPTMSSVCALVARKLPGEFYMNVNITAPHALESAQDVSAAFTLDGIDLTDPANSTGVTVVPLALRSMFVADQCCVSSDRAKVLVSGPTEQACAQIMQRLQVSNGIALDG